MFRSALPQASNTLLLDTCGIETTLIFTEGVQLPEFAASDLLLRPEGELTMMKFYNKNLEIAEEFGLGMVIDTATWRASSDWLPKLGHSPLLLPEILQRSLSLLFQLRSSHPKVPLIISGCIGPRGDGYTITAKMSASEAESYHWPEVQEFAKGQADIVTAITITYVEEAIGIVQAARRENIPVAVSFTVETDGLLPSGQSLHSAITEVDSATDNYTSYFLINCAHPSHFRSFLYSDSPAVLRIKGILANASTKSHAELNDCDTVDSGDPELLAAELAEIRQRLPHITVIGGCCGTDYRHTRAIAAALSGI